MKELINCGLVTLLCLYGCLVCGTLLLRLIKQPFRISWAIIIGFFLYFFIFQIFYLPLVLTQQPLSKLIFVWKIVYGVLLLVGTVASMKIWYEAIKERFWDCWMNKWHVVLLLLAVGAVVFQGWYMVRYGYTGYDTQYYISSVGTSVYTDSMYLYDPTSGMKASTIEYRYALSSFYMNAAVLCKVFGIHAAQMLRYVMGSLCDILSAFILFELGRSIVRPHDDADGYWVVIIGIFLNFFFRSDFTTAEFLLRRSYEAKAICGNLIFPVILLTCIWIWKSTLNKTQWFFLLIVAWSCDTISMSSILIAPVMIAACMVAKLVVSKEWKIIPKTVIVLIPCVLYCIVYYLSRIGIIVTQVR